MLSNSQVDVPESSSEEKLELEIGGKDEQAFSLFLASTHYTVSTTRLQAERRIAS